MSLCHPNTLLLRYKPYWHSHSYPSISASLDSRVIERKASVDCLDSKERIRKLFNKVELSVSAYDTAWVAMVPCPNASQTPCFPECVNWLLDNQFSDGSWGVNHHHPLLIKDALTSTLACVLALKQWGVGEDKINKGLQFIKSKFTSAIDENQHHPVGFDIIFPGMLDRAKDLDLNLSLEPTVLAAIHHNRELELGGKFSNGREAYLAYASEGMGKLQDWNAVMKYQRKNGSIFNSPSTTAAALIYSQNDGCLNYLHSLLKKFGNAVPTVYPLDIYTSLCMVDSLEKLGIERHFRKEIRSVLDETYRCWLQGEEEIFMDCATCAMAFRVLRLNGYNISSDLLTQFTKEELDSDSPRGHLKDISAALELYKASQIVVYPDELALEEQNSWSYSFLKQKLFNGSSHKDGKNKDIFKEADDALKFPFYAKLERMENRRKIENYDVDGTNILKTSYCSPNISSKDFLKVAVEDFNFCQSIHREELEHFERWVVKNRLDKLKFARQKSAYSYFSAAATLFSPELSDARMSWAKNSILTAIVDDLFDIGGSMEELKNLIHLVEKWDANVGPNCCSEQVQIIFSALHCTICEIGGNAFAYQGCNMTSQVKEIWLNLLNSMLREAEWVRDKSVPTIDEYMTNGYVSFALGPIVLPALYLVGPELSRDDVCNSELHRLYMLMSTCGRLLNDIHSFKRESKEGKLNALSLHMIYQRNPISEEELAGEIKSVIKSNQRELLRLVLEEKGSVIPRACKDLFWKMCKVLNMFYLKDDGFNSNELISAVKAVIHEPISADDL